MCEGRCVTPSIMVTVSPDEGVTRCEVCNVELTGYSNAKTCSSRCRVKLHRMKKSR